MSRYYVGDLEVQSKKASPERRRASKRSEVRNPRFPIIRLRSGKQVGTENS